MKKLLIVFAILLSCLFAACSIPEFGAAVEIPPEAPAATEPEKNDPEAPAPQEPEAPVTNEDPLELAFGRCEIPEKLPENSAVIMEESEYCAQLKLLVTRTVTNLRLIHIEETYDSEGNTVGIFERDEIGGIDEVTPDMTVYFSCETGEYSPFRAITLVDPEGNTRYFMITESGEDGSVSLLEFEISK